MICEKKFACSTENTDEIFLEVAEEIKKGYTVASVRFLDLEFSGYARPKPSFEIIMKKKERY